MIVADNYMDLTAGTALTAMYCALHGWSLTGSDGGGPRRRRPWRTGIAAGIAILPHARIAAVLVLLILIFVRRPLREWMVDFGHITQCLLWHILSIAHWMTTSWIVQTLITGRLVVLWFNTSCKSRAPWMPASIRDSVSSNTSNETKRIICSYLGPQGVQTPNSHSSIP